MKKILLSCCLLLAIAFSGCSSDDSGSDRSVVTAKIGGVDYIFNTINVDQETYTEGDYTYTDVIVTASINNNPDRRISFVIEEGVVGLEASWYFAYFNNEMAHPKMDGFQTSVTENTGNKIVGTFAGQVQADTEPFDVVPVQNGTFTIRY